MPVCSFKLQWYVLRTEEQQAISLLVDSLLIARDYSLVCCLKMEG